MPLPNRGDFNWDVPLNASIIALQTGLDGKSAVKNGGDVALTALTDTAGYYTINDDGTPSGSWPNRMQFSYKAAGGVTHLTGYHNEYGEVRCVPAKGATVPFRIFGGTTAADYTARDMTVPVLHVASDRANVTDKFCVYADGHAMFAGAVTMPSLTTTGNVTANNVAQKVRCVPTGTTGFASEPDGTLWIEYTP